MSIMMLKRKQISAKKIRNIISNEISRWKKKLSDLYPPSLILLEPACMCNLKCRLCKLGNDNIKREKGLMNFNMPKKIIDEIGDELFTILFTNWGEPFLNNQLLEMVRYASERKIFTKINTSGHLVKTREMAEGIINSGLDEIVVALDGLTEEIYLENRVGGDFYAVTEGMKLLGEMKRLKSSKNPCVKMLFIITKKNEHQRNKVPAFAKNLGVDRYIIKTANLAYIPVANRAEFIPDNMDYSRYRSEDFTLKERILYGCMRAWHSAVVLWDGRVVPCCNDDEGDYVMGDLNKNSFMEIWNGKKYSNFRDMLITSKSNIPMCKNCPGTLIWKSVKHENTVYQST